MLHPPPRPDGHGRRPMVQGHGPSAANPHPYLQAFEPIQPVDGLAIDGPALAPQDNPNPLVPESRPRHRDLANPQPERRLLARVTTRRWPGTTPPGHAARRASVFLSERFREHVLIEGEIGDESLQAIVSSSS